MANKEQDVILSSDEVRHEFFGDKTKQISRIVYRVLYERLNELVSEGKSVIVDATDIERDRRMFSLVKLKDVYTVCYYFDTPYEICLHRNQTRKRTVEMRITEKMKKNLEFSMIGGGFNELQIIHEPFHYDISKGDISFSRQRCLNQTLFLSGGFNSLNFSANI